MFYESSETCTLLHANGCDSHSQIEEGLSIQAVLPLRHMPTLVQAVAASGR